MILAPTLTLSAGSGAAIVRPTFSRDFAGEKTLDNGTGPAITFTRASDATFFDATGTLQTAANNTPRFDHDPATGASLGLLVEEQRTNLLLNSATLATQTVTVTAVAHTLSFYGTGEVVLSGAHSATVTGTGAFPTRTTLTFTPAAGSLTATVSGTVENAQLEIGSFATSYIPTTTATATRSADSASITPITSFYNATESTLFHETTVYADAATPVVFQIDDTSTVNRIFISAEVGATAGVAGMVNAGIQPFVATANLAAATHKVAAAFKTDDFAVSTNGASAITDNSGAMPTGLTHARIGNNITGRNTCHIRKVAYWPKRLPDAMLEQLTT
jgi:hypothetical protein